MSIAPPTLETVETVETLLDEARAAHTPDDILSLTTRILRLDPLQIEALLLRAEALEAKGSHAIALEFYQALALLCPDRSALLGGIGRSAARVDLHHRALCAFQRRVEINPCDSMALDRLSGLYGLVNREALARHWAVEAARIRPLGNHPATKHQKLSLLMFVTLGAGTSVYVPAGDSVQTGEGHNNLATVLDQEHITLYTLRIDALGDDLKALENLPKVDVIYNAISEAVRCKEALDLAERLCQTQTLPIINPPSAVLKTTRQDTYDRLQDLPGLLGAKAVSLGVVDGDITQTVRQAIADNGFTAPVIMRAAGFEGGKNMHLLQTPNTVNISLTAPATVYLIQYHEVGFTDPRAPGVRLYPKYRAFLVGDDLFPAHLFVTEDNYNVHRDTSAAAYARYPWLEADQDRFLSDPENHFAPGQWDQLRCLLRRTGMDYLGVDFAPSTDPQTAGRLVIFEANAGMRNSLQENQGRRYEAYHHITQALHHHICNRAAVDPWDFTFGTPATASPHPSQKDTKTLNTLPILKQLQEIIENKGNEYPDSPFFQSLRFMDEELIEAEARRQGLEVRLHPAQAMEVSTAEKTVVFTVNAPGLAVFAQGLTLDKMIAKLWLASRNIPVPEGRCFTQYAEALEYFLSRPTPQVVKPSCESASQGVTVNIRTQDGFQAAWDKAAAFAQPIMVEDHCVGRELRLYVLGGKTIAAAIRLPAYVIGNGRDSLNSLIEAKNWRRLRNPDTWRGRLLQLPPPQGNHIPAVGEWVWLGSINLASSGGEWISVTDCLHPGFFSLGEAIVAGIPGLAVCGIDVILGDLTAPPEPGNAWVTEINSTPALNGHVFPTAGPPLDIPPLLLRYALENLAYPRQQPSAPQLAPAPPYDPAPGVAAFSRGPLLQEEVLQCTAHSRNLTVEQISPLLYTIASPGRKIGFSHGMPCQTSVVARQASNHKEWARQRLNLAGIPTPQGSVFTPNEDKQAWALAQSFPSSAVVKPVDGSGGRAISLNIKDHDSFLKAWKSALASGTHQVVVEDYRPGRDYRLLVIGSALVAVTERQPAHVVGDGQSTLKALVAAKNETRQANPFHGAGRLTLTDTACRFLETQGLNPESIPPAGQSVPLHRIANVSSGGEGIDVTHETHPGFAAIAATALKQFFNAPHAGVDLLAEDISRAPEEQSWVIVEINLNPDLALHHFPWQGQPLDVAGCLIDHLLPEDCREAPRSWHLRIAGRVQGVGYRHWFWRQMHIHALSGWVRNRPDGSVEAVVHGQPNAVTHLQEVSRRGPEGARVDTLSCQPWNGPAPQGIVILRDDG